MKNHLCVDILVLRALAHYFSTLFHNISIRLYRFALSFDCTIINADITHTIMNVSSSNEEVLEPLMQAETQSGSTAAEISIKKTRRRQGHYL